MIIREVLQELLLFLENPEAITKAKTSENSQTVYLALWTLALKDAIASSGFGA